MKRNPHPGPPPQAGEGENSGAFVLPPSLAGEGRGGGFHRRITRLLAIAFFLLVAPAIAWADCPAPPQATLDTSEMDIETASGVHPITVELATTEREKACGLMMRQHLAANEGMLFDYRPGGPAFMWMKNTVIPLDMLFVDTEGRVVHIEEGAVPFSLQPRGTAATVAGVVELRAGTVDRLGIRKGDRVRHSLFE